MLTCIAIKNKSMYQLFHKQDYYYVISRKFLLSHFSVFIQVLMLIPPADARICSVVFEPAAALANDP